ncbi:KOW domain-containing RNA-binding protein [Peptococcaceae bacterium]|nr:KOW domain-containing RNA-binding protein [Peptococcaceae bacterium]MCL0100437.1 KOW domain-containing RNA-binding protein [Peptococcaceae bacterium]
MQNLQVSQLVYSTAGSDKGQLYVVVGINTKDSRVLLANGKSRKISNPKPKNLKHIKETDIISKDIQERILKDKKPSNADIKNFIEQNMHVMAV